MTFAREATNAVKISLVGILGPLCIQLFHFYLSLTHMNALFYSYYNYLRKTAVFDNVH